MKSRLTHFQPQIIQSNLLALQYI